MGDKTAQGLRRMGVQSPTVAEISANPKKYRKMSEAAVQNEFETGIAPYFDYSTAPTAKESRYVGTPGLKDGYELPLGGYTVPGDATPGELEEHRRNYRYTGSRGEQIQLPLEPGTINAVGKNATPNVWAHEKRHMLNEDGNGERYNRLADAATAQNPQDWKGANRMWRDQMYRERKKKWGKAAKAPLPSVAERDLLGALENNHSITPRNVYKNDFDRGARRPGTEAAFWQKPSAKYEQERIDKSHWKRRADELAGFDKWDKGLRSRNNERSGKDRYGNPIKPSATKLRNAAATGLRNFANAVDVFGIGHKQNRSKK